MWWVGEHPPSPAEGKKKAGRNTSKRRGGRLRGEGVHRCACFPRTPRFSWLGGHPRGGPAQAARCVEREGWYSGWQQPSALTRSPRPVLTHMAMSLASPGVKASSGPTSFTAEKWSWSWGQESATWGSWYTSWRWGAERRG